MSWFTQSNEERDAAEQAEAHNKGQEDASKGVDDAPNSWLSEQFSEQAEAVNDAYRAGQENHHNQTK